MTTQRWRDNNPDKIKKSNNTYYMTNKDAQKARVKARKQLLKKLMRAYKQGKQCKLCGETHPACLQFHHRDRQQKDFNLSEAAGRGFCITRIEREMAKCDLICANCHFKLHAECS